MIWTEVQRDRHFPILHNNVGAPPGPKWIYSWLNERNFLPGGWFCLLSFWLSYKQLQHGLEIFNFQSKIFLSNWLSISQAAWSSTTMEHLAQRMSVSWSGSSSLAAGETILMILFGRKIEKYSILCIDFILPCWKFDDRIRTKSTDDGFMDQKVL